MNLRLSCIASSIIVHHFFECFAPLLHIHWTAPLDSTSCRRFVVVLANLRQDNAEGSRGKWRALAFPLYPHDYFSRFTRLLLSIRTIVSVNPHDCFRQTIMPLVCNDKKMLLSVVLRSIFEKKMCLVLCTLYLVLCSCDYHSYLSSSRSFVRIWSELSIDVSSLTGRVLDGACINISRCDTFTSISGWIYFFIVLWFFNKK